MTECSGLFSKDKSQGKSRGKSRSKRNYDPLPFLGQIL